MKYIITERQYRLLEEEHSSDERTEYNGYKVGDIIVSDGNEPYTGGKVFPIEGEKYELVQKNLDDFNYSRDTLWQEGYKFLLKKIKKNFNKFPPIPEEGDGQYRIVAAKELGHKTILMWKKIGDEIFEIYFKGYDNNWDVVQKILERRGNPPYKLIGNLNLRNANIESLGNLISVDGSLNLRNSTIESLGSLKYVRGNLDLFNTNIETLGNLKYVGGSLKAPNKSITSLGNLESVAGALELNYSNIKSLGNLKSVGSELELHGTKIETLGNLKYVGGNLWLGETPLSKKITAEELRKMPNLTIEGDIGI